MKRNWIQKFFEPVFNPWSAENILDLLTAHKDDKVIKGIEKKETVDLVAEGQPVVIQSGSLKIIRPIKAPEVYVKE